jgi:hypothetical protein
MVVGDDNQLVACVMSRRWWWYRQQVLSSDVCPTGHGVAWSQSDFAVGRWQPGARQ